MVRGASPGGVNSDDLVTLAGLWTAKAICEGLIAGPLSENEVLTPAEVTSLQDAIEGYNAVIADASRSVGAVLVDIATLLADADVNGYWIGPDKLTTDYCGGVFSLDGVHPTNSGYAVVANAFIAAMNEQLAYAIPPVDVAAVWANEPAKNLCVAVP